MRERVQQAVSELGYRPFVGARAMRGATYTVGVSSLDTRNLFFGLIADGVQQAMERAGYGVLATLVGAGEGSQLESAESVIDHRMDGLILITPRMSRRSLDAFAHKIPTVVIGRHGSGDAYDSVASDDAAGARLVVDHLVGLGHRHIAYYSQRVSRTAGLPEELRESGYRSAMADHGLQPDVVVGDWTQEAGRAAATALLERPCRPTAIHAGADIAAFGFLGTFWDRGVRVPDEISVAGCDNTPVAAMTPIGLTSVDQRGHAMGEQAAQLLIERIRRPRAGRHFLVPPRLIARTSTAAPR